MKFRNTLAACVALIPVALLSTPAFAQSAGSVDFDDEIVVTGSATQDVGGIVIPNTPKAKQVLDQAIIRHQRPGQRSEERREGKSVSVRVGPGGRRLIKKTKTRSL